MYDGILLLLHDYEYCYKLLEKLFHVSDYRYI